MLEGAPGISGCAAGSAMPFHEQPVDNAIATYQVESFDLEMRIATLDLLNDLVRRRSQ